MQGFKISSVPLKWCVMQNSKIVLLVPDCNIVILCSENNLLIKSVTYVQYWFAQFLNLVSKHK